MQLVRVRLRQTWITPGGERYRGPGEQYIPYDMMRLLPSSAEMLEDDEYLLEANRVSLLAQLEARAEYWGSNPHGQSPELVDGRMRAIAKRREELTNG